jgi:hypothetical protein
MDNPPELEGQYAGGLLQGMMAGASSSTSKYSAIRSTELKSSSSCADILGHVLLCGR